MLTSDLLHITKEQMCKGIWVTGDKNNGEFRKWHKDKSIALSFFHKNGKRNGPYFQWYPGNKIHIEASFLDDVLHGEFKVYSRNGELTEHLLYELGEVVHYEKVSYHTKESKNLIDLRNSSIPW